MLDGGSTGRSWGTGEGVVHMGLARTGEGCNTGESWGNWRVVVQVGLVGTMKGGGSTGEYWGY